MKISDFLLLIIVIIYFYSCSNKHEKPNIASRKDNHALLSEFNNAIEGVKIIDSLYYLTDKYEQKLITRKVPFESVAKFYHKAANKFYSYSKYDVSMEYFKKAEQAYIKAGDTMMGIKMRGNQAVLLDMKGHYKEAIKIFLDISEYFQKNNDTLPLAFAYSNIGVIYEELNIPEKAIAYGKKALYLKQLVDDTLHQASNYNNIGVNFDELLNNPDSAIFYYQKALEIYKQYKKVDKYATVLNNLGRMYLDKLNYQKAEQSFAKVFHIYDSLGYNNEIAAVLRNQGELYFHKGQIKPALEKIQKAYNIYTETKFSKGLVETSELMSKIYMAEGRFGEAAEMMQQHNMLNDSLLSNENQAIIADMETKYQLKEKNKIINMLKLQDQLHSKQIKMQTLFIVFMIVVIILLIFLFYSNNKQNNLRQQKLRLELQNYLLRLNEMQNKLENKSDDCGKKTNLNQLNDFNLSKQEMKVIKLIAEGYKNAEIAEKLFVSQNTIKTHIKNIYSKLDVKNRVEALRKVKDSV